MGGEPIKPKENKQETATTSSADIGISLNLSANDAQEVASPQLDASSSPLSLDSRDRDLQEAKRLCDITEGTIRLIMSWYFKYFNNINIIHNANGRWYEEKVNGWIKWIGCSIIIVSE